MCPVCSPPILSRFAGHNGLVAVSLAPVLLHFAPSQTHHTCTEQSPPAPYSGRIPSQGGKEGGCP